MAERDRDSAPGLLDLTGIPLGDLAELDDALLSRTLEQLLPASGDLSDRLWSDKSHQRRERDASRRG
jgi:FXSXX-COOH protein